MRPDYSYRLPTAQVASRDAPARANLRHRVDWLAFLRRPPNRISP
jgi:hypothetical protein